MRFECFILAMDIKNASRKRRVTALSCWLWCWFSKLSRIMARKKTMFLQAEYFASKKNYNRIKFIYFAKLNNAKVRRLTRCPRKFGPPKIWSPRAKFPRKYGPPRGPYFLGNLAPLSEIWPPFTNMDVKQFCARAMHCKCINFVTIIYYSTHVR